MALSAAADVALATAKTVESATTIMVAELEKRDLGDGAFYAYDQVVQSSTGIEALCSAIRRFQAAHERSSDDATKQRLVSANKNYKR